MYEESIQILKKLETDFLLQQNATLEKEKEVKRKEKEFERAARQWKAKEIEAKRRLKGKTQRELQEYTDRDELLQKESHSKVTGTKPTHTL